MISYYYLSFYCFLRIKTANLKVHHTYRQDFLYIICSYQLLLCLFFCLIVCFVNQFLQTVTITMKVYSIWISFTVSISYLISHITLLPEALSPRFQRCQAACPSLLNASSLVPPSSKSAFNSTYGSIAHADYYLYQISISSETFLLSSFKESEFIGLYYHSGILLYSY